MKYPNKKEIGICNKCSNLKFFLKINNCKATNKILKRIVNCPRVRENFKLST